MFGLSIFTYCENQPILRADHDGHEGKIVIGAGFNTVHDYSYKDIADAKILMTKLKRDIRTWGYRFQRFNEEKWPDRFKTAAEFQKFVPSNAKLTSIVPGFRHYTSAEKAMEATLSASVWTILLSPFSIIGSMLSLGITYSEALGHTGNAGDYLSITYTYSRDFALADSYNTEQYTTYTEYWWIREIFNADGSDDFTEGGYVNPAEGLSGIYIFEGF